MSIEEKDDPDKKISLNETKMKKMFNQSNNQIK